MIAKGAGRGGRCRVCGSRLKKNGTTSAGRTRWRCTGCGASSTRSRPDVTRRAQFDGFIRWLLGPTSQQHAGAGSSRSFRRDTAWCWAVEPVLEPTGEIHVEVQVDGIYLSSNWCCLIASTQGKVIAWQWCDREKSIAWQALMDPLPAPTVVVCDGGTGLLPAIEIAWADAKVQRCLVHVQRNIRTHLTSRPKTDAGKALWGLARSLTRIATTEQAVAWLQQLNDWHEVYGHLTRERTYLGQQRDGQLAPAWARPGQRWWYTHDRLRRAYRLLAKLAQRGHLFTYLDPEHAHLGISSTTNHAEGGINAGIRDLLRRHRGMPEEHQRRAVEWFLTVHALDPVDPWAFVQPQHYDPPPREQPADDEPLGPASYDTGLTADEGLWHRRGWAGRS